MAKPQDVIELAKIAYQANVPLLLSGRHGVGKSETLEQAAQAMGLEAVVLDLSLLEGVDLLGIPITEDGVTRYASPAVLPREGRGLLVLEELNRAMPQTRAPALELLTRRQLHQYYLPSGWLPCGTINPAKENYHVDQLDPALLARFIVVEIEPDLDGWIRWARTRKLHPRVLEFASGLPDLFASPDVNPRSLTYAAKVLSAAEGTNASLENLTVLLAGLIGEPLAVSLLRYLRGSDAPLTAEDVVVRYDVTRPTLLAQIANGRLDVVRNTVQQVEKWLGRQARWDELEADPDQDRNFDAFLDDLPADLQAQIEGWMVDRGYAEQLERP